MLKNRKNTLNKLIVRNNFLKHKRCLLSLRKWTPTDISNFLLEYGFKEKAQNFLQQGIDGNTFITLLSTDCEYCSNIFKFDLKLDENEVKRLKDMYEFIYHFRKLYARDFEIDEYPVHDKTYFV